MSTGPVKLSHLSTEYVHVTFAASADGVSYVAPNDLRSALAFPRKDVEPVELDWNDALLSGTPGRIKARVLVGPEGVVTLTPGVYDVWLRITDEPEKPVRRAGSILIE